MTKLKLKKETSAGGIVFKKTSNGVVWLVTQHSLHKGWGFPKGLIGDIVENEPMEEAALREVKEEGGIEARIVNPKPVEVKYKYTFKETLVDKNVFYFLMEYVSGSPDDHDWEVSEAKFMTEEEVKKILTFKTDQEAFEGVLKLYRSR